MYLIIHLSLSIFLYIFMISILIFIFSDTANIKLDSRSRTYLYPTVYKCYTNIGKCITRACNVNYVVLNTFSVDVSRTWTTNPTGKYLIKLYHYLNHSDICIVLFLVLIYKSNNSAEHGKIFLKINNSLPSFQKKCKKQINHLI